MEYNIVEDKKVNSKNQLFRTWIRKLRNVYLSYEMPLSRLLDAEKELIHVFNSYFHNLDE